MDATIRALAEPRRREILELIRTTELPAGEIAAQFAVTRPAISQHLQILRDAGLVTERRQGTRRLYRARPAGLASLRTYLDTFWDEKLERLKPAAETDTLEREIRIRATPETVFSFLVDPMRMVEWFGTAATLDPRPGGVYRVEV